MILYAIVLIVFTKYCISAIIRGEGRVLTNLAKVTLLMSYLTVGLVISNDEGLWITSHSLDSIFTYTTLLVLVEHSYSLVTTSRIVRLLECLNLVRYLLMINLATEVFYYINMDLYAISRLIWYTYLCYVITVVY